MKKIPNLKPGILFFAISLVGGFTGKMIYDLSNKPDGYLYLDKDTKSVYADLKKDPDKYKDGTKLIFLFKN